VKEYAMSFCSSVFIGGFSNSNDRMGYSSSGLNLRSQKGSKIVKSMNVSQLRYDVRFRLSHEKLMEKYDISEAQLRKVFYKLMNAVANGQTDILLRDS
jgi:hypothetical protein